MSMYVHIFDSVVRGSAYPAPAFRAALTPRAGGAGWLEGALAASRPPARRIAVRAGWVARGRTEVGG